MIRELEEELHMALFMRHGHGVELPDAGKRIYAHACAVIRDADLLIRACMEDHGRKLCISFVSDSMAPEVFARFCRLKQDEEIRYQFLDAPVGEILGHVHRHISELGLVYVLRRKKSVRS